MGTVRWPISFLVGLTGIFLLGACGGGQEATPTPRPTIAQARPSPTPVPTTAASNIAPTPQATARPTAPAIQTTATPTVTVAPTQGPRTPSGKLTVALATLSSEDFDPITAPGSVVWSYGGAIFDWVVWHSRDGGLSKGVAEQWEQAPDGLAWTFTLRRGMRFHNGEPLTAEDVRFNLDRLGNPTATSTITAQWRSTGASAAATGPATVVVRLKQPWPTLPTFLTPDSGSAGVVYPKSPFDRADSRAFAASPVGSGPFKFAALRSGIRITFEAAGYEHPYRPQPDYQTLDVLLIPEESTRSAMLRTGVTDIIDVSPEGAANAKNSGASILQIPGITQVSLKMWGLGNSEGIKALPTGDLKVRQALQLAVNKQEIVDTLLGGFGAVPPREVVVTGTEGFDPSWKPVPYDPARAKQLLAEAGYGRGFTQRLFNTSIPGAPWTMRAAEAIAGYWAAVGVQSELIPIDYAVWRTMYREDPHKRILGAYGWLFSAKRFNTIGNLATVYRSGSAQHLLSDPEVDAATDRALLTQSAEERAQLIRKIVDIAFNTYISIPVAETPMLYATSAKVGGWTPINVGGPGLAWETVRRK